MYVTFNFYNFNTTNFAFQVYMLYIILLPAKVNDIGYQNVCQVSLVDQTS